MSNEAAGVGVEPAPAGDEADEQTAARLLKAAEVGPDRLADLLRQLEPEDARAISAALASLARTRSELAGEVLAIAAQTLADKRLQKEARRGLHHLRAVGVSAPAAPVSTAPPADWRPQPARAIEAWAECPDGEGSRWMHVAAEPPSGGLVVATLVLNQLAGLKRATFFDTTRKRFDQSVAGVRQDQSWASLPVHYACELVGEAVALNRETNTPIPHEYQIQARRIQDLERPFGEALIYRHVGAGQVRLAPDRLERSHTLFDEMELFGWWFAFAEVRPFAERWREALRSPIVLASASKEDRANAVLSEAIIHVLKPPVRRGLKRRLEEAAFIFWSRQRLPQARRAVAAAVSLEAEAPRTLILGQAPQGGLLANPFLRAMMERSLRRALGEKEA